MARVITITLRAAFFDSTEATADGVAESLVRYLCDGLDAEIAHTTKRLEQEVAIADPDEPAAAGPEPYTEWQAMLREAMDNEAMDKGGS